MKHIHNNWRRDNLVKYRWRKKLRRQRIKRYRKSFGGGYKKEPANLTIMPPKIFSLSKNYDETVKCLHDLKMEIKKNLNNPNEARNIVIDLSKIEDIRPAAAVVLAAELDRWRQLGKRKKLNPVNLKSWNKITLNYLHELGLFELLGIEESVLEKHTQGLDIENKRKVALRFVSGGSENRDMASQLAEKVAEIIPNFNVGHETKRALDHETKMALSTGLVEASLNSLHHAYPEDELEELVFPVVETHWWAAASYDLDTDGAETVKFIVYDQGVGIPKTLPKTDVGSAILKRLEKFKDAMFSQTDSDLITEVLKLKKPQSSTGKSNRGKGFPQIVKAASYAGGQLRLISGKGHAIYTKEKGAKSLGDHRHHLGGTLVEWTFRLGES